MAKKLKWRQTDFPLWLLEAALLLQLLPLMTEYKLNFCKNFYVFKTKHFPVFYRLHVLKVFFFLSLSLCLCIIYWNTLALKFRGLCLPGCLSPWTDFRPRKCPFIHGCKLETLILADFYSFFLSQQERNEYLKNFMFE